MNDTSDRARQERHNVRVGTITDGGVLEQQIDRERIARRAYEIYESRHRADGHADDDWFQAAAEHAARLESHTSAFKHAGPIRWLSYRGRSVRR